MQFFFFFLDSSFSAFYNVIDWTPLFFCVHQSFALLDSQFFRISLLYSYQSSSVILFWLWLFCTCLHVTFVCYSKQIIDGKRSLLHISQPYHLPLYHMFQNNLKTRKDHGSIRCVDSHGPDAGKCGRSWANWLFNLLRDLFIQYLILFLWWRAVRPFSC